MPGEEKVTASSQYPAVERGSQEPGMDSVEVEKGLAARVRRVIQILGIAAVLVIGFYLLLYLQTETRPWQLLAAAGFVGLALLCLGLAYRLLRQNKFDAAGYLTLFGLVIAYGGGEMVFSGATWYITLGGLFLVLLMGSLVFPRKWSAWLISAGLFGLYVWLVNRFEPVPRYDVTQSVWLSAFIPGIAVVLGLGVVWQAIRAFRVGTIRARLLIAFTGVVLLTALLISIGAAYIGFENGREEVIAQLEAAAIFKEAEIKTWTEALQTDLAILLSQTETSLRTQALLQERAFSRPTQQGLRADFERMMGLTGRFDELFVLDRTGEVILSSDPLQEGKVYSEEPYFIEGLDGPYFQTPTYFPSLEQVAIIVARPVLSQDGEESLGVLAGRSNMDRLNEIMLERTGIGETGETYLVGSNKALLTESRFPGYEPRRTYVRSEAAVAATEDHTNGAKLYQDYRDVPVTGAYRWLPDLQVAILSEQDQAEAFEAIYEGLLTNVWIALGAGFIAILLGLFVTATISIPLSQLAQTATEIAAGDLGREVELAREDEIGDLSQAFNSMTTQLRSLIGSLEEQVQERTAELALSMEVGQRAVAIRDLDELLPDITEFIRDRFDLYYTHIYFIDDIGQNLVIKAGTGSVGEALLARRHSLPVGGGSIVGRVADTGKSVVVSNTETSDIHQPNPLLPETRSELAVPLLVEGRVTGVLDMQSSRVDTFTERNLTVFEAMATQLALSIDSAQQWTLAQEAQKKSVETLRQFTREAWGEKLTREKRDYGFAYDLVSIIPLKSKPKNGGLSVPVTVQSEQIGAITVQQPAQRNWSSEEELLVGAVAQQLAQKAENLRLFEQTQQRAAREQVARQITDKIRASRDIEAALKTAAEELSRALGTAKAVVDLKVALQPEQPDSSPDGNRSAEIEEEPAE